MKKIIFALFVVTTLSSCSILYQTATERDVQAPIVSAVISDLDVADQRISYTYVPTKKVRRGGDQNCIDQAISEALKEGGYDVLVETQQAVVERYGLLGRKIASVTVTGYPAKYKNFRAADEKTLNDAIVAGTLVGKENKKSPLRMFKFFNFK